jgi:phospholipid/cholesterol/gamma-HCH transport system substrate-binding protein
MSRFSRTAERVGLDPRALIGISVLIGGTLLWVLAFTGGINGLFASSTHTMKASFNSIEDIVSNDPVRVNGVQVGTVSGTEVNPNGEGATVTINLESSAPTIYRNAHANILWRTALGANDAISIDPGTPSAGRLGSATLPQSQNTNQVELDQITQSAFQGGAQQGTRTALQQLAIGFSTTPQILSNDFNTLAQIAPDANVGIGAVRGEIPDTDLKHLVRNAGAAAQAITVGTSGSVTRQFVQSAATTLTSLGANQADLRGTIDKLAPVSDRLQQTFADVETVSDHLRPLVSELNPVVPQVAPTLADLHPVLTHADTLLHDALPLLRQLKPTVDSVAATAKAGVPVIDALNPSLIKLETDVLPALNEKYPEEGGRPVYSIVGPTLDQLNIANYYNSTGNMADFTLGPEDLTGIQILPCNLDFAGEDLLVCESLADTLSSVFTGGTNLLKSLAVKPGMAKTYDPLLKTAEASQNAVSDLKSQLEAKFPSVAKVLFKGEAGSGS